MSLWTADDKQQQTGELHEGQPRTDLAERGRANLWNVASQRPRAEQGTDLRDQGAHPERQIDAAERPVQREGSERLLSSKGAARQESF